MSSIKIDCPSINVAKAIAVGLYAKGYRIGNAEDDDDDSGTEYDDQRGNVIENQGTNCSLTKYMYINDNTKLYEFLFINSEETQEDINEEFNSTDNELVSFTEYLPTYLKRCSR